MLERGVGERIKCLRELNHYTRERFAEMAGISSKFLYEIEMGKKGFSAETLLHISDALEVSCDYLLTGNKSDDRVMEQIARTLYDITPQQMIRIGEMLKIVRDLCKDI